MTLRPIPFQILSQTAVVHAPASMDVWQKVIYQDTTVNNVHLQGSNDTHRAADNTEVVLRAKLFVDARLSQPALDYEAMQQAAQATGSTLRLTVGAEDFRVLTVDGVPDDFGQLHHWELGLV